MRRHVVFVAPRFLENTLRFVRAFASLEEVALSLVSQDPEEALAPELRARIVGHYRVDDPLAAADIARAARALASGVGPIDRLTGALEQLQLPLAEAREAVGIDGMGVELARNFRDKDRMKQRLREAGVPVARSRLCHSLDEVRAFVREVGLPVVVKPQAGLGSKATVRVETPEELERLPAVGLAPHPSAPLQVEEFVRAREFTCETVTVLGTPVWRSGTRYFPSPLEVLEQPWIQYCVLLPREQDDPQWTQFAPHNEAALRALGLTEGAAASALTHMEWFLREDGSMLVSEVGARPPGVHIMPMMALAHDFDVFRAWAELVALDRWNAPPRRWACGAAFFRAQGNGGRVARIAGVDEALAAVGDAVVEVRLPRVGQERASSYEGEGYALVRHETTEGAKAALHRLVSTIQVIAGG
ncbi:MAG TPA: ATP-grasp domain-containing protein [Polyangia bacterium]|jgi:biotin carboxylase|nr:ATP-grasp domain-containing protein [Polyangia bacterium]